MAAIKRPIMPTTKMLVWIRSEYVIMGRPPFPRMQGARRCPQSLSGAEPPTVTGSAVIIIV